MFSQKLWNDLVTKGRRVNEDKSVSPCVRSDGLRSSSVLKTEEKGRYMCTNAGSFCVHTPTSSM